MTANKAGQVTAFSRFPIPYCRDVPLADWPTYLYNRHIGIYAYRASVLTELAASSPSALERLELVHAGVDCLDDVCRVREILNNSVSK